MKLAQSLLSKMAKSRLKPEIIAGIKSSRMAAADQCRPRRQDHDMPTSAHELPAYD